MFKKEKIWGKKNRNSPGEIKPNSKGAKKALLEEGLRNSPFAQIPVKC